MAVSRRVILGETVLQAGVELGRIRDLHELITETEGYQIGIGRGTNRVSI